MQGLNGIRRGKGKGKGKEKPAAEIKSLAMFVGGVTRLKSTTSSTKQGLTNTKLVNNKIIKDIKSHFLGQRNDFCQ